MQVSDEEKSAPTRVSEFRARFEKFGSSKLKKGGTLEAEARKGEKDAQEVCRELQKQLNELENLREKERSQLMEKLEKQREEFEKEIHQLRERNIMVSSLYPFTDLTSSGIIMYRMM